MSKWILGVLVLALIGSSLYLRHQAAVEAKRQANAIVAADTAGQDTAAAQAKLKDYAAAHMGASTSFMLSGSYQRAQTAATQAAAAAQAANSQIYAEAQRVCGGKSDSVTQAKCNQDYLAKHLSTTPTPTPVPAPQAASYQHQVKAPLWTPDLAGALLAGGAVAFVLGLIVAFTRRRPRL